MKRLLNNILTFSFVFLLAACATAPTHEKIKSANYGEKPTKAEMVSAVQNYMSKRLFDPYSATYSCSSPVKSWVMANGFKTYYGYTSECAINAKNQFGGYTGDHEYTFMIYGKGNGQYYFEYFDGYSQFEQVPE